MGFKDRVAIVTGAGAGIGLETAAKFAERGTKVVGIARSLSSEETFFERINAAGGDAIFLIGDVAKPGDCERVVNAAVEKYGKIDYLCNIAGVVAGGNCVETSEETYRNIMDIDVFGTFQMCKLTIPHMLKKGGGSIVNVASIVGYRAVKDRCAYSMAKAAVIGLTKSIAIDYIRQGIKCNAICPGTTYTPSLEKRFQTSQNPEQMRRDFNERQPMGRLGTPQEIAESVLFACDDDIKFMTGVSLPIDGGFSM